MGRIFKIPVEIVVREQWPVFFLGGFFFSVIYVCVFPKKVFFILCPHPWHMEVPPARG